MVEGKSRARLYFVAFLLPAFALYTVFFIYPFVRGFAISLTNWDGLSPRAPNLIDSRVFEDEVLSALDRAADREYLGSVYEPTADGSARRRRSLSGFARRRVESILARAGHESEYNRFVGVKNYADILTGKVSESFYPRTFSQSWFNASASLPDRLEGADFERYFLARLTPEERDTFGRFYAPEGGDSGAYVLDGRFVEFHLEDLIWLIPEVEDAGAIPSEEAGYLVDAVKAASLARDPAAVDAAVEGFVASHSLTDESRASVTAGARGLYSIGEVKLLLANRWSKTGTDLGVVGFTLFFTVCSVIGINVLAFLLALALDSGLSGQRFLRSVFFLPNVLSMIIVALVWKMLFVQLFPRLTGIEQWMSDPGKTPWLIVLVAVWQGAGYYMIVYLAGLQNIPTDVVEAARIDGAGPFQRFRSITLPLLVPALTISLFLTLANALKSFDLIYAMTSGSAYTFGTVPVVLDIYFDAFARKQAGLAAAKAMLLFAVILSVTAVQLSLMKRREVEQ